MELFFSAFTSTLTPQTVFSILGGILGAMISSDRKRYGWQLSLLFGVAAIAVAAAVGEYLQYSREVTSIWWLFVINIPTGMVVGSTLDVLRISSPPLIERLIKGIGDSGVSIVVETFLKKLSRLLGADPTYFDNKNDIKDGTVESAKDTFINDKVFSGATGTKAVNDIDKTNTDDDTEV